MLAVVPASIGGTMSLRWELCVSMAFQKCEKPAKTGCIGKKVQTSAGGVFQRIEV